MAMAPLVEDYLSRHDARYDLVAHPHSRFSIETADAAGVPGERLVKAVLLEDDDGMVLAVLPSTRSVHLGHLTTGMQRRLRLADEAELLGVFTDCEPGAIPPLGPAYGVRTILDDSLEAQPELFFEAGDHEHLVHMSASQFMALVGPAKTFHFSQAHRRSP